MQGRASVVFEAASVRALLGTLSQKGDDLGIPNPKKGTTLEFPGRLTWAPVVLTALSVPDVDLPVREISASRGDNVTQWLQTLGLQVYIDNSIYFGT